MCHRVGRGSRCVESIYRSNTLCIWPDSESTKLLYHPKQKPRRGGRLRQIITCRQVPLQVNFKKSWHLGSVSLWLFGPCLIVFAGSALSCTGCRSSPPVCGRGPLRPRPGRLRPRHPLRTRHRLRAGGPAARRPATPTTTPASQEPSACRPSGRCASLQLRLRRGRAGGRIELRAEGAEQRCRGCDRRVPGAPTRRPHPGGQVCVTGNYKRIHFLKNDKKGIFLDIFLYTVFNTAHLPPIRFYCVGGCLDPTQDCCDFLTARQSNHSARSHPQSATCRSHQKIKKNDGTGNGICLHCSKSFWTYQPRSSGYFKLNDTNGLVVQLFLFFSGQDTTTRIVSGMKH